MPTLSDQGPAGNPRTDSRTDAFLILDPDDRCAAELLRQCPRSIRPGPQPLNKIATLREQFAKAHAFPLAEPFTEAQVARLIASRFRAQRRVLHHRLGNAFLGGRPTAGKDAV
jgi:hypothetical protein